MVQDDFGVNDRVQVYVTDQASNNVKFGGINSEKLRIGCDAHALHHLVITDAVSKVPETVNLVKRCKAIIRALIWRRDDIKFEWEALTEKLTQVNNNSVFIKLLFISLKVGGT